MKGIMDKTSRLAWLCSKKIYFKNKRWNIHALGAVVCWFQAEISPEQPPTYREQVNEDPTFWEIHRPDPETPMSHRIYYSFATPETRCGSFSDEIFKTIPWPWSIPGFTLLFRDRTSQSKENLDFCFISAQLLQCVGSKSSGLNSGTGSEYWHWLLSPRPPFPPP